MSGFSYDIKRIAPFKNVSAYLFNKYHICVHYNWRVPRVVFIVWFFLRFSSVSSKYHNNIRRHTHAHTWSRKDVRGRCTRWPICARGVGRSVADEETSKRKKITHAYNLAKFAKTKTRSLRCWRLRVCHGLGVGAKAPRWYSTGILRMCATRSAAVTVVGLSYYFIFLIRDANRSYFISHWS